MVKALIYLRVKYCDVSVKIFTITAKNRLPLNCTKELIEYAA